MGLVGWAAKPQQIYPARPGHFAYWLAAHNYILLPARFGFTCPACITPMSTAYTIRPLPARKRIALVAHDHKKDDLIDWAFYNRTILARHELFATGTTGRLLEEALDRPVRKLMSGPLGGDQQIGAMIASGDMDVLIFFWDPMEAQPHDTDIKALLRLAAVWNLPMATDRSTADFLLTSPLMHDVYEVKVPDYTQYLKRTIPK